MCDDVGEGAGSGSGIRLVHGGGSAVNPDIYNFEKDFFKQKKSNDQ
mgnify:CR=1 FL=1